MWALVIIEYIRTSSWIALLTNAILSALICFAIFYFPDECKFSSLIDQFVNNSTSVLSLLVGFTVAMFTLLITASNPNIDKIKEEKSGYFLYSESVSIFKMLLIRTTYIILIESILLLFNLMFPFLFSSNSDYGRFSFFINVFLMTHIIIVSITNTVDLYFVLTKKEKKPRISKST